MRSWSVSSVRGFHTCQLQWYLRRTNVPEERRSVPLVEGTVLHAALAFHLTGQQQGAIPAEDEVLEFIEAAWFAEECGAGAPIQYGTLDRSALIDRLRTLYRHWRGEARIEGEIVAVERELRVDLPGIDLPLLGYLDLVLRTPMGEQVIDFKSSAAKPSSDVLLDPLDLQKLAMTRGWEADSGRPVATWSWHHLVKTKAPQLVDRSLPVREEDRQRDLDRLASVVQPTIESMAAVLDGRLRPVPTQASGWACANCGYRRRCAGGALAGAGDAPSRVGG